MSNRSGLAAIGIPRAELVKPRGNPLHWPPCGNAPRWLQRFAQLPETSYVTGEVVAALFGVSPSTLYGQCFTGQMPRPSMNGFVSIGWNVGRVRHWLYKKALTSGPCPRCVEGCKYWRAES